MSAYINEGFNYGAPITSSANVMASHGVLGGFWVASYAPGATVAVFDSKTTGTSKPVLAATAIDRVGPWPISAILSDGCYIVTTGTINLTPLTRPTSEI